MRIGGVIAIHAVLDQQLPVRPHRVFELAFHEFHLAQIERVIEDGHGIAHVAFEALDLRVEADEDAAAVIVHPRRRLQAQRVAVEGFAVGFLSGNAFQFAAGIINPAVIEAAEDFGAVTFVFAADQVAAVTAGVQQGADLAVLAMHQDQRPTGHRTRHEVAWVWEFRLVAREQPAMIENPRPLLLENVSVDKDAPMDPENAVLSVVNDQTSGVTAISHHFLLLRRLAARSPQAAD